ncbi:hypothetical protein ACFSUS_20045 [Spirosoma soli]|uniref:Esterase-like activity of phytase family protein n=1 Tax=Spirosoma soli TaxID=1770529 RepID=A0ABW5M7J7_9BACT
MNYRLCTVLVALMMLGYGCKTSKSVTSNTTPGTATIAEEGLLTCFTAGTMLDGKPVWCEASAVLFDGTNVFLANDKDMPSGQSPVFSKPLASLADSTRAPTYLTQAPYTTAHKYEDFAQTPDGKFVFLTTAFDRVKPGSPNWDGYNTILYWRKGDEQNPRVLAPNDTSRTSMAYRQRIARLLANDEFPGEMPYFKVEGLAATDRQLLFGIREEGKAFDNFKYRSKIIAVSYLIEEVGNAERIRLADDWKLIADFDPAKAESALPQPLALSSLEYDTYRNRFWLLTSLELNGQLDAYLWTATPDELMTNKPFTLMRNAQGQPLHVGHKAEDVTPLDRNRLLLIHDDDRALTTVGKRIRQPNQAAYTILKIK